MLRRDQGFTGPQVGNVTALASSDPYRTDYGSAVYSYTGKRYAMSGSVDASRETHTIQTNINRKRVGGGFTVSRTMNERLSLGVDSRYGREQFVNVDTKFNDWYVDGFLNWTLGRGVHVTARAGEFSGSGDGLHTYKEKRASLFFEYGRRH